MNSNGQAADPLDPVQTRKRLLRNTLWVSVFATLLALVAGGAGFGLSIGLGAALGILNVRWVAASLRAIIDSAVAEGPVQRGAAWKFVLRYLVIGACILVALQTGWFSLPGILLGLCCFVGAAMIEGIYALFLSYRHAAI